MSTVNLLVGRQPIFDRASRVAGYELLFARGSDDRVFDTPQDEDLAWAGMDCVEVAPAYDHAEITSLAAATFVWTYLCGRVASVSRTPAMTQPAS